MKLYSKQVLPLFTCSVGIYSRHNKLIKSFDYIQEQLGITLVKKVYYILNNSYLNQKMPILVWKVYQFQQ